MVLAAAVVRAPTDAAGDAPAADTPPRERGGGSSGGETGLVQLHPNIGELKKHPEVIKRILEQAPTVQSSVLVLDEQADGTLAAEGALSSGSLGTLSRQKSISVIHTPAEGVKHEHPVSTPRPRCQWFAPSVAVVEFTRQDSAAPADAAAAAAVTAAEPAHLRTYKMDPKKRVPSWRMNGKKEFTGVEGLYKWSFTPEGTDDDYMKRHRMTLYQLDDAPRFYLMLVHSPGSNNAKHRDKAGKKRPWVSDPDKAVRDVKKAFANLKPHLRDRPELMQQLVAVEQELASLQQNGLSSDVMRGGGSAVLKITNSPQLPSWEDRIEEFFNELERIQAELLDVKVLVCLEQREGDLSGAQEEVETIQDIFGVNHVDVISATSGALGEALLGEQSYNIIHFIGHGDAGDQFCLRTDVSGKHFNMVALCDVLRTHNSERGGKLRLVFFNACHSEEQGVLLRSIDVDDGGVASVMCVAGMIADKTIAVPFSRDFYSELSKQLALDQDVDRTSGQWALCVDLAYHHARQAILDDPERRKVMSAHPKLLAQPMQEDPLIFVRADWAAQTEEFSSDRGYQQRLVAAAEQKNSIFVLRTGAGKTRIALRLAELALYRFPSQRIVFTAPTAALVEQQMQVFSAELQRQQDSSSIGATICIGGHFGGKNRGNPDANLLFFTPAKLVDFLQTNADACGVERSNLGLSMENISLLIVDECHHTRGASPLTTVAELYRTSDRKPRFLGLTALPIKHDDDAKAVASEPIGVGAVRQDTSLEGLCACWMAHLDTVEPGSAEDEEMLRHVPVPDIIARALDGPAAHQLKQNLQALKEKGVNPNADEHEAMEIEAKLPLVVTELQHSAVHTFRAIIFVHNRSNAHLLLEKLRTCSALDGYGIQAECVTGHSKSGGMKLAHQKRVLDRFRSGSLNVIVATSVAEEGLDIPQCNLVVRLDAAVTDIGFVQSRGRARYPQAKYVVACSSLSEVEALIDGERSVLAKVWELCSRHRELPSPCETTWEPSTLHDMKGSLGGPPVAVPAGPVADASFLREAQVAQMHSPAVPSPLSEQMHLMQKVPPPPPSLLSQQKDPTMELNEYCQRTGIFAGPDYKETRLAEQKFQCSVSVAGGPAATGQAASSKKEAKKNAAAQWLAQNHIAQSTGEASPASSSNSVAELNEFCQSTGIGAPQYQSTQLAEQQFQCSVRVQTDEPGVAVLGELASSKMAAKRSAAAKWLAQYHAAAH